MPKIFFLKRIDDGDYIDEYSEFVVIADDEKEAFSILRKDKGEWYNEDRLKCYEIIPQNADKGILIGRFHAG